MIGVEDTEDTLSKKEIFDGKVISLRVEKVKLCDGRVEDREIVAHNGGVGVIAFDDDNNVFMVRQYRLAARRSMLEIPAGKLEKNDNTLENKLKVRINTKNGQGICQGCKNKNTSYNT